MFCLVLVLGQGLPASLRVPGQQAGTADSQGRLSRRLSPRPTSRSNGLPGRQERRELRLMAAARTWRTRDTETPQHHPPPSQLQPVTAPNTPCTSVEVRHNSTSPRTLPLPLAFADHFASGRPIALQLSIAMLPATPAKDTNTFIFHAVGHRDRELKIAFVSWEYDHGQLQLQQVRRPMLNACAYAHAHDHMHARPRCHRSSQIFMSCICLQMVMAIDKELRRTAFSSSARCRLLRARRGGGVRVAGVACVEWHASSRRGRHWRG